MPSYSMFSHVTRAPGTIVHKARGETGAKYDTREGGIGAGVGYDGSPHIRCRAEALPAYGTKEREALQPPEDSALRWSEVNCPDCLALKYTAPPIGRDASAWCACGHERPVHVNGVCWRCAELGAHGACDKEVA